MQASAAFLSGRTLGAPSPLQGGPAFAAFALNTSALLMMLASLGVVLASKIVLGLLLGLGPVFVLFLLFDSTRGLFEGWLRASLAAAISPLMAIFALVVQLTLLEPHVVRLAELRTQGLVDLAPANAIFLLTMVCTMVSAGLGLAIAVIAFSLRLPGLGQSAPTAGKTASAVTPAAQSRPVIDARSTAGIELQTRAASIAAAAAALERRDVRTLSGAAGGSAGGPRSPGMAAPREGNTSVWASAQSLPSTLRRSATPRRSSSNLRRDG